MRQGPIRNGSSFLGVDRDALGRDIVAEEAGGVLGEGTLGEFDFEIGSGESLEDLFYVHKVILLGLGINQYIIQENDNGLVEEGLKDSLHEAHEGGRGVCETKGHNGKLITSITGFEGGFVYVIGVNAALVVT